MSCLRTSIVAAAVMGALVVSVQAADVSKWPSLPLPRALAENSLPMAPDAFGPYIRADLAYRVQRVGSASVMIPPNPADNSLKNTVMVGVRYGYKFKWVRFDITADYGFRSKYAGSTGGVGMYSAKIDSMSVLANGYLDLGTWFGLTPYVGAGVGGSNLTTSEYGTPNPIFTTVPTNSRWNMAWAYMAGASLALSPKAMIDIGYRHIQLGDAIGGPSANTLTIKNISADEIRVGLRWLLDQGP